MDRRRGLRSPRAAPVDDRVAPRRPGRRDRRGRARLPLGGRVGQRARLQPGRRDLGAALGRVRARRQARAPLRRQRLPRQPHRHAVGQLHQGRGPRPRRLRRRQQRRLGPIRTRAVVRRLERGADLPRGHLRHQQHAHAAGRGDRAGGHLRRGDAGREPVPGRGLGRLGDRLRPRGRRVAAARRLLLVELLPRHPGRGDGLRHRRVRRHAPEHRVLPGGSVPQGDGRPGGPLRRAAGAGPALSPGRRGSLPRLGGGGGAGAGRRRGARGAAPRRRGGGGPGELAGLRRRHGPLRGGGRAGRRAGHLAGPGVVGVGRRGRHRG